MAPYLGPAFVFFGLVKISVAVLVSIGLFYLLIKLAGLADAITKAKGATH
ncbi:hypothetical protein [[Eubacterium] cellulosolvens]